MYLAIKYADIFFGYLESNETLKKLTYEITLNPLRVFIEVVKISRKNTPPTPCWKLRGLSERFCRPL